MEEKSSEYYIRKHLKIGWLGLVLFLALGIAIESLHGLKLPYYLDLKNSSRRLMWTLAHSHGTLFALINIAFAFTIPKLNSRKHLQWISISLVLGLCGMPLSFFAAGVWLQKGEPGLAVFLVPVFAFIMLAGVALTYFSMDSGPRETAWKSPATKAGIRKN